MVAASRASKESTASLRSASGSMRSASGSMRSNASADKVSATGSLRSNASDREELPATTEADVDLAATNVELEPISDDAPEPYSEEADVGKPSLGWKDLLPSASPATAGEKVMRKQTKKQLLQEAAVAGRRMSMVQPRASKEEDTVIAGPTLASNCTASGRNFRTATVREASSFTIVAANAFGRQQKEGGDPFVVSIRSGGVKLRSKLRDNNDGTYTVRFKPEASGSEGPWHRARVVRERATI